MRYSKSGAKIKEDVNKIEKTIESNTKRTKNVGNQKVIFAEDGCQLFKMGLTNPNFLTCK